MPIPKTTADDVTPLYPSGHFVAFTPEDDTVLERVRGVYTEGAGDLVVENATGTEVTFARQAEGDFLPISPRKVKESSTVTTVILLY